MNNEILFTPAALLDFLLQIDELAEYEISVREANGNVMIQIGDSSYTIDTDTAQEVEVTPDVVDEVAEINDSTYEEVANTEYTQTPDIPADAPIEGGLIREILKTLAVGGMVRLTGKMLGKDVADAVLKK